MELRTRQYLTTAERNQGFAIEIAGDYSGVPPSHEWAVVVAFYAAVHYINAFLWEVARVEPEHHEDRAFLMSRWTELSTAIPAYRRMLAVSFQARYRPAFRVDTRVLDRQLDSDLSAVAGAIRGYLIDR